MGFARLDAAGEFFIRLPYGSELLAEVREFAVKSNVSSGFFTVIGAVEEAVLGFYRQDALEYVEERFIEPLEIASCTGNVMIKDGKCFVHAHACLSRKDASIVGGHLLSARVFVGEVFFKSFGNRLTRRFDEKTGLFLAEFPHQK